MGDLFLSIDDSYFADKCITGSVSDIEEIVEKSFLYKSLEVIFCTQEILYLKNHPDLSVHFYRNWHNEIEKSDYASWLAYSKSG